MKKLILVRFSPTMQPNPAVTAALKPHMKMNPRPIAFPVPGAIVTLMVTDSTLEQVRDSINATGSMFVLADLENAKVQLPQEIMNSQMLRNYISQEPQRPAPRVWTLDELLDIVAANGIDSLTPEQMAALNALS